MHENLGKNILVDWLTFTIEVKDFCYTGEGEDTEYLKDLDLLGTILDFLGLPSDLEFMEKRGLYGYEQGYYLDGLRICFGGTDTIMVDMTGEGCRLYESLNGLDWLALISKVMGLRWYHFSRMDVACDTFGTLKMPHLLRYTLEHRYISRWKSTPRIVQGREETIDFGSPQSKIMLRIYNKTLERQCKTDIAPEEIPQGWVRCELQLRNEAVESFIREWTSYGEISTVYMGIMAGHLRFVRERPKQETNLERLETVSWWRRFLDNAQPIKLAYRGGLAYNLESLNRYVFIQAGSSIRTWLEVTGGDVGMLSAGVRTRTYNDRQLGLLQLQGALKKSEVMENAE